MYKRLTIQNKHMLYGDEGNKTKEFSLTAGVGWCSNGGQPLG